MTENKPNYNDNQGNYANTYGQPQYPANYTYRSTNDLYDEDSNGTGSFIAGAIIGGLIGAATALFLAPKTGREMREDLTTQASQLKEKSIELSATAKDKAVELSSTAKDKAAEFSSTAKDKTADFTDTAKEKTAAFTTAAKDKTSEFSQTLQEQSGQLVDKVKSAASKTSIPMDDGTASSEGEEATDYKSTKENNEVSGSLSKAKESSNKKEDQNAKSEKSSNDNKNNDKNNGPKADASTAKKDDKQSKDNNPAAKKDNKVNSK